MYENVPETLAVAFNCVPLNAVPTLIAVGFAHEITGFPFNTLICAVTDPELKLEEVGVKLAVNVCPLPAGNEVPFPGL